MYCVEVWVNTYKSTINPLVILQKQAVLNIYKVGFLDHSQNVFIQSKVPKCLDLVIYNTNIILYIAFNKKSPVNPHFFTI